MIVLIAGGNKEGKKVFLNLIQEAEFDFRFYIEVDEKITYDVKFRCEKEFAEKVFNNFQMVFFGELVNKGVE